MEQIGLQAVFDDSNFQAGVKRYTQALGPLDTKTTQTATSMTRAGGAAGGMGSALAGVGGAAGGAGSSLTTLAGVVGGVTLAFGALVSIAAVLKGGFDSLLQWSNQIDELQDILGVTTEDATKMALSMKHVGISVEDGTSAFAFFARQVANTDRQIKQSDAAIASASKDAADQTATVWGDLARQRTKIQSDLAEKISNIEDALGRDLADKARSHSLELAAMARDAQKIDADAAKSMASVEADRIKSEAKLELDTAKSLADVDKNLKDSLRNARTVRDRRDLKRQAAERKADILAEMAERRAEIEQEAAQRKADIIEQRNERQQELAERRALLVQEFEYRRQQSEEEAARQIETARKSAVEQTAAANEAAAKQAQTIAAALDKSIASMRTTLANDPFMQAIKSLNIDLYDTEGKLRPVTALLSDARDTISQMPDGVDKTNAIIQLLGRGGKTFLDWMSLTNDQVNQIYEKNKDAYLLSQQQQEQVQNLQRQWNDIRIAVEGIALSLATSILPSVIQLTDYINTNLMPAIRELQKTASGKGNALDEAIYRAMGLSEAEIKFRMENGMLAPYPGKASGGPIPTTQPYLLHAGEYVLNRQQAMQFAPMLAGATTSNSYNFSNTWNGNTSTADRAAIEKWAEDAAYRGIRRVVRQR